jgi:erythromycin esterase-like protein
MAVSVIELRKPGLRRLVAILAWCALATAAAAQPSVTDRVVHDLCGKRVALLGEAPAHGFGKTLEFKAEVVRRLVDECHFQAFFIESGAYDFLNIEKKLKAGAGVDEAMIAAGIGGLWANREVEALIPFLLKKAQAGALVIGGLDDQLSRGTWAQREMPAELASYLQGDDKRQCLATLQRHTLWQYTSDAPYGPKDRALILACLDKIDTAIAMRPRRESPDYEYDSAMVANLKRILARDSLADSLTGDNLGIQTFNDRDKSMYQNFRWWMSQLQAHSKVIVWTANNHASKDLSGVPTREKFIPLGSYIRREFKDQSFALEISAASGSYAMARQPARLLTPSPADSIEGRAFANQSADVRYFNEKEIRKLGSVPARPVTTDFKTAKWDQVLDGLVVIREERPPELPSRSR